MSKKERFKIEICDTTNEMLQFHQEIVMLFVLEGSLDVTIEDKSAHLKAEDILVVNANKQHTIKSNGNVLYMSLMIDPSLITEVIQIDSIIFWCDTSSSENGRYEDLRILVRRMLNHYIENTGQVGGFSYLSDCYAILNHLTANFMIHPGDELVGDTEEGDRYQERLQQINNFIYANYDQPISMKELSEKLFLSNGYLSRFFKKNYGMSFANYLTNVRIYHAVDDLLYTDMPITGIAYNNGFASAALFNKAFKKAYNVTPTEFRKKNMPEIQEKENQEHQKALEKRLEKVLSRSEDEEEDTTRAGITVGEFSAKELEPLKPFWSKIINFGAASNLLQSAVREHLLILHNALGFEYVRFWNIFSRELFIDPTQEGEFNFSRIDSILDFVLEQGMKPFIELSMKPSYLHYEVGNGVSEVTENARMDDITVEMWERLMSAFMRHLVNRYGQDVMDDWKMELWYDEDWRMNPEKYNQKYFDFFNVSWEQIKDIDENIQFGGYSIRMDFGEEQRREFLHQWTLQPHQPDFITVMYYGYERSGNGADEFATRSTDNEALMHLLYYEKKLMREMGFGDTPIYMNEWNLTPSVRNYINDTTFKGAYIVKNIIDTYGMIDAMGYGAATDRSCLYFDTADILFGGTGLLTNDGIMKPAAFAFEFLNNRLFPYFLGKTRNYLVTTDKHDNYAIVCHNQQQLNYNYYLTRETELDRSSMWKYYENRTKQNIRIRIEDVADGTYTVKIYRVNDNFGSVMKVWEDLDFEKEPSRNDIKYFRRACEPNMAIRRTQAIGGVLMIEEQLLPNEIAVVRVHRLH